MNTLQSNRIFRKAIITGFFEPELIRLDYKRSGVRHPLIPDAGLMRTDILHLFFDTETGADYQDGDEWFIVDYLLPREIDLPDRMKGPDQFTTMPSGDGRAFRRHRELVRYKHGRSKKLSEALDYMGSKYDALHASLLALPVLD